MEKIKDWLSTVGENIWNNPLEFLKGLGLTLVCIWAICFIVKQLVKLKK